MMLVDWNSAATQWATACISEAYSRMFRFRPVFPDEALELSSAMATAFDSMPQNEAVAEHRSLYSAIAGRLTGRDASTPVIRDDLNPIVQSHRLAAEILAVDSCSATAVAVRGFFLDKRGWWEDSNYRWSADGRIEHGFGVSYHILIFFPAVRLALCAIGRSCGWLDPAYTWTQERQRATLICKDENFKSRHASQKSTQPRALIEQLLRDLPDQDRPWGEYGHMLLLDGDPEGARAAIQNALALQLSEGRERGGFHYNLACAFARLGDAHQCEVNLAQAKEYGGLDADWAMQDCDLKSVRETEWFQKIVIVAS